MKKKVMLVLSLLTVFLLPLSSINAQEKGDKKAKCEKCYRGPDGKIVCEQVACPDKK